MTLWFRQYWWLLPLTLLVALLSWGLGNWQLLQQLAHYQQQSLVQSQQIQQSEQAKAEALRQRDFVATELAVEKNTNQLLQQDIKEQQQKLFDLKKELAVYQKIVAPVPESGTLVIDSFRLQPGSAVGRYQFSVLLIEQNKQKKQTRAQLEIKLKGKRKKKSVEVDLLKLAGYTNKTKRLVIKNFRTVEGEFVLPAGFVPEKLQIRLNSNSGQGGSTIALTKELVWDGQSEILD
ncbi:DUF6776 family protein [Rheinheimera texasensis]|uniref:DUF6776 family protein n=1 Tax=Rheinheimera texasensis TaxID=306205 RepID=UPI0032B2BD20